MGRGDATRPQGRRIDGMHVERSEPAAEAALTAVEALFLARRFARSAAHRWRLREADASDDIAAESLLILVEKALPLCAPMVWAVVSRVARRHARRRAADREIVCGDGILVEEMERAPGAALHPAPDEALSVEEQPTPVRVFGDGSRVTLPD